MQPVNKKLLLRTIPTIFVIACFIFGSIYWFSGINQQNVNGDEPTWIGMTEMYQYRKHHDWSKFKLDQTVTRNGWGNERNILVDQPQGAKYIFGFLLDLTHHNPWEKENMSWIYDDFSKQVIPNDSPPEQLTSYLGTPLAEAIETARIFTTFIGWLTLLIFSFIVYKYTRNLLTTGITFLLVSFNPIILNYFRKALTDGLSVFALLITGILIWVGMNKILQGKNVSRVFFLIAGITAALASSIKINGLFAALFPLWLLYITFIVEPKLVNKYIQGILFCFLLFFLGFIITFCFLEPVTWFSPVKGVVTMLQTRLIQQNRFLGLPGKVNYPSMPMFALYIFFRDLKWVLIIPLIFTLALGFTQLLKKTMHKNSLEIKILATLFFVFATNFYYAQTGFDRYLIPTIFCFLFINAVGLTLLFTKVQMYVTHKTKNLL